jgi:hypothetical protein
VATRIAPLIRDAETRHRLVEEHRVATESEIHEQHVPRQTASAELIEVQDYFRRADVPGKYVLVATPDRLGWRIAQLSGVRGEPPVVVDGAVYSSRGAAEHAVFLRRVSDYLAECASSEARAAR